MQDTPKLNPQQKKAVEHTTGPLLIVAGAGTGKTTVITEKIAYLVEQKKAQTDEILALTFTDKAAGEMEERVDKLLPYGYTDLWIMTFHAFCERILKQHGLDIGLPTDFKLLNQTEQWLLVRQNLDKFNLDYYHPLGNPTKFIHELIKHFSKCKDEEINPADYLKYAEKLKVNQDNMESTGGRGKKQTNNEAIEQSNNDSSEINRLEEVANAYHIYQQLLLDNNSLDFGDLINYTLKLFRERPNILKKYQQQFKYILVDEFQDTNWAQYELVKLLLNKNQDLTVVGDDDQCLPGNTLVSLPNKKKKISQIKVGDEIITAVGKGHLGTQKVKRIFKNKKNANLLTIKTKSGKTLKVTDNHKMFCFVSAKTNPKHHYVYLMYRQNLGWRIGTTNNLISRLRLERSADLILAISAFNTENEARYFETLWSLKYNIPTSCFKARQGIVIKDDLLKKLYTQLDVESGVKNLAQELNIDLRHFHHCLDGVTRGQGKRIKINLTMCHRNHRSKEHVKKNKYLIKNPLISHSLNLQTSNKKIIKKLTQAGYKLKTTKQGKRLRIDSKDIKKIGKIAENLEKLTNGFVVTKFNLGKINYQHLPSIVIPAKNCLPGMHLPIKIKNKIIYDEIISINAKKINSFVYDLEIDKTHNFIANDVVIHNSIYKFRGASVSNIMQFKKDFSNAQEITLNENYRSTQNILDLAHNFIQLNNPERLESKLKLSKKLKSNTNESGIIEHLNCSTAQDEVIGVVNKITELYNAEKNPNWNDFAILIRANNQAEPFSNALRQAGIPFNFVASKGLYNKEIILDIIAYLKLLDNYHESMALWRILNLPMADIRPEDLMQITNYARRKTISLFETCEQINILQNIEPRTKKIITRTLELITKHTQLAKNKSVKNIILEFLKDFNYKKYLLDNNRDNDFIFINQLINKIDEFENSFDDKSVKNFINLFNLELESGESGSLSKELQEGPESVKIMTIHAAKGLEFKHVFIVNLVDKRFPSMNRQDKIQLPDELVKETIPEGDIHLQEERRLFYVACTRAKTNLYFTSAQDYGGQRKKKLSRFLHETDFAIEKTLKTQQQGDKMTSYQENKIKEKNSNKKLPITSYRLPVTFSYSQLKAYETCPYQYYLNFILKIPVTGKAVFSYGKTMHNTLQKFFNLIKQISNYNQNDLFNNLKSSQTPERSPEAPARSATAVAGGSPPRGLPPIKKLLDLYKESWQDDWYEDKSQKEKYKKQGEQSLKEYYKQLEKNIPQVIENEKDFSLKLDKYTIKGRIDRVDLIKNDSHNSDRIEIVDYKTGAAKDIKKIEKDQLLIYQMAGQEIFNWDIEKLTFYYLDNNSAVSFLGTPEEIQKQKEKMLNLIEKITSQNFTADPSQFKCKYCDFKEICSYRLSS